MIEHAIVLHLCHPIIRETVRPYITKDDFKADEPRAFLDAIMSAEFTNSVPDVNSFAVRLHRVPKVSETTVKDCLKMFKSYKRVKLSREKINNRVKQVESFIRAARVNRSIYDMVNSPDPLMSTVGSDEYTRLTEAMNFAIENEDDFVDLSDDGAVIKAKDAVLPKGAKIIKSSFSVVNTNLQYKGFKYGDLVALGAETGTGKTTIAINEAAHFINQGFKVVHVFLGDMDVFDAYVNYTAVWTQGALLDEVAASYENYRTDELKKKFKQLRIKAYEPEEITVTELIAKLRRLKRKFPFDVLIIDYDGNLKELNTDSMYKEGGNTYAHLKGFSKGRHVTYVLSQIKPEFYGMEVLPKECLNESSKKQAHVDYMLAFGRNEHCDAVGTGNLAKARRGRSRIQFRVRFKGPYGKVSEVSQETYDATITKHKNKHAVEGYADAE